MRFFRPVLLVACLVSTVLCYAQKMEWLPITQQDLQMKEVPGHPGASAVRLYFAQDIDDNASTETVYQRIKILSEKGAEPGAYADAQIPILDNPNVYVTVSDLRARTIHPDGSIVEFTGKPYEKVIVKGRGAKLAVKAFSFPAVTVGSIVEYQYHIHYRTPWFSPFIVFSSERWNIQSDLFTVKEHLHFRPYEGGVGHDTTHESLANEWDGAKISRVMVNLKEKPKSRGNEEELDLQNVQPFDSEDYMPPEDNYKPSVIFFYSRKGVSNATDKAWEDLAKDRSEFLDEWLGRNRGVKEAALKAIGDESEPGMKLRKLYESAQHVRNFSYERERDSEERKKENIQVNRGVEDVLAHGYGFDDEITLLFIAMARAAGFDASPVQVSDRSKSFFNKEYISLAQIDDIVAAVKLNGQDLYLDPGVKFCPYGMLPWKHTATDGLKLDRKGGTFVKATPADYEKSVTRRNANVAVSEDGTLKGELTVEYKGYDALERRLDVVLSDDAGKKKTMEDEMKDLLPVGALVTMTSAEGWEGSDDPLVVHFNIEVPGYATVAGKRFLMPSYLFRITHKEAFQHADRKYPVYFAYPFGEFDNINTRLPAGYSVESVPEQQNAGVGYAKYVSVTQFDGMQLVTQRKLLFNGIYVDQSKYPELRAFFNKVQTGDEQQAVLHGGSASAQKGN